MKAKLTLIVLLVSYTNIFGQDENIKDQIINFPSPKNELIAKGRGLIIDRFLSADLAKVKEVKDYLVSEVEDNDFAAFYPVELWLIDYWIGDYNQILEMLSRDIDYESMGFERKIKPPRDMLYEKLKERSIDSKKAIIGSIEKDNLTDEQKDFLIMHLTYLISDDEFNPSQQEELNRLADNFLFKFKGSVFEEYTRRYIRYKLVVSDWSLGFEFFSGAGIFTGDLSELYTTNYPFGVAFDIGYKKFMLYLRDYIGIGLTKKPVLFDNGNYIWEKGADVRVFQAEASIGYVLVDIKSIRFAPFVGIAATDIGPTPYAITQDPTLEEVELMFTTTYALGFTLDFKIKGPKMNIVSYGPEQNFWFVRLRYGYTMPQFQNKYPGYSGDMHYIAIGFGGIGSKVTRDI